MLEAVRAENSSRTTLMPFRVSRLKFRIRYNDRAPKARLSRKAFRSLFDAESFVFVPNQTIGSIHARRLTSHEAELTKMEQARMEKAGEVSDNAQIRCPACGKLSPTRADACSCGFRFGRALG